MILKILKKIFLSIIGLSILFMLGIFFASSQFKKIFRWFHLNESSCILCSHEKCVVEKIIIYKACAYCASILIFSRTQSIFIFNKRNLIGIKRFFFLQIYFFFYKCNENTNWKYKCNSSLNRTIYSSSSTFAIIKYYLKKRYFNFNFIKYTRTRFCLSSFFLQ